MSKPTNATPKALSDEELAQEDLRRMDALIPAELRRLSKKEPYRNIRLSLVEAAEAVTRLLATIDALKAQPSPVPLAEDEALIARFKEIVTFCNTMGPRGSISVNDLGTLCNILERLSLRSGQLAQALALQRYGLSPHAPECGLFRGKEGAWVRYSELKAAIEGAK